MLPLSRRVREQLGSLQTSVRTLALQRSQALRMLLAARDVTTEAAQQEFWLEFCLIDQEYRVAVLRLAEFCKKHFPRRNLKK